MLTPFSQPLKSEPAATGDHWVQIWTGNSAELFGQRERKPASICQVERLIGADVDVGRIHRTRRRRTSRADRSGNRWPAAV